MSQGWLRMWIILSAFWICGLVGLVVLDEYDATPPPGFVLDSRFYTAGFWFLTLLPPLVAGIVMLSIGWIVAGFRR